MAMIYTSARRWSQFTERYENGVAAFQGNNLSEAERWFKTALEGWVPTDEANVSALLYLAQVQALQGKETAALKNIHAIASLFETIRTGLGE
ncbi:MAG: hypothetical protein SP1CHLAM54_01250 [Chlamydiia bacterium]|nr:hypothetical protein [Chlamydiia bacterium]MCH9615046.1 hypothetical protein [Chlamydiia bacterium]MCH9629903.1 hypothetical protein [Chlamydiia bacterium]